MKDNSLRKILTLFFIFTITAMSLQAQTVRDITVSYDKSYTDHVSLASDSRDMDLMVKFIFDEDKNQLTVSLISYRYLFVFREDARYGTIIHHNRLDPEDLPYVAEFPEKSRFLLSKGFRKSIPKPQKDYIFRKWIEYRGLQPVAMKYKMVNDYIEQTFDVTNYGKNVMVKLGDVYLMDKTPTKKHPDDFTFVAGKNINIEYRITIVRNPCFGLEAEIEVTQNTLSAVKEAYSNYKNIYASGQTDDERIYNSFHDMKGVLLKQFPPKKSESTCPAIKELWDEYDCYVDSIASMKFILNKIEEGEGKPVNFDISLVSSMARQLDRNVSRWLLSKDAVERQDLEKECEDIIIEINGIIGKSSGSTPEQKKAVAIFRQAEAYYRATCGKKR